MTRVPAACLRLERRVAADIEAYGIFAPSEGVVLLLSGGADSMAMLALLLRLQRRRGLGLRLAALHVDYATRGAESDRDRDIVERACAAAGVPLQVVRLRQRLSGGDFQARARELRYGRARELAVEGGFTAIATAHNRDDQAETILYRLAKYASPRGLIGMRPRDGDVARPLLGLSAAEIRDYCGVREIEYGDDVTNAAPVYARNRLRLEVVPRLEELNPRLSETLHATASQAAAEADLLAALVADARTRVTRPRGLGAGRGATGPPDVDWDESPGVDVVALAAEPVALRPLVLHDLLRAAMGGEALVERRLVAAVLALAEPGRGDGRVSLGRGLEAIREGGAVRIAPVQAPHRCASVAVRGATLTAGGGEREGVTVAFCSRVCHVWLVPGPAFDHAAALRGHGFIGLDEAPETVILRHPRRGERFEPLGLGRETTVARYLAGARAPAPARHRALVVDVDGSVAWVGHTSAGGTVVGRVAQRFRVAQSSSCTLHVFQEDS